MLVYPEFRNLISEMQRILVKILRLRDIITIVSFCALNLLLFHSIDKATLNKILPSIFKNLFWSLIFKHLEGSSTMKKTSFIDDNSCRCASSSTGIYRKSYILVAVIILNSGSNSGSSITALSPEIKFTSLVRFLDSVKLDIAKTKWGTKPTLTGEQGPFHKAYVTLRECNYHGDQYCSHYVAMVDTSTKHYVRFVKRVPVHLQSIRPSVFSGLSVYRTTDNRMDTTIGEHEVNTWHLCESGSSQEVVLVNSVLFHKCSLFLS